MLKPIVKWAGGKRQIMNELLKHFPNEFRNYFEPFAGGLSVCLELYNNGALKDKVVFISDIMSPLICTYRVVRDSPIELLAEIQNDKYTITLPNFTVNKQRFNEIKRQLEGNDTQNENLNEIELAALFLYLNKTCFNGMYRENLKGEYNVPYGKQKNPTIVNTDTINNLSKFLTDVILCCGTYNVIQDVVQPNDFVYLDPPYYNTFTGYTKETFGEGEQIELRNFVNTLTSIGCKVAISNSDHPFIRELYAGYTFFPIPVKRVINSKGDERKNVKQELLITNYGGGAAGV